jgi:unsaturated pyranuronate lyase
MSETSAFADIATIAPQRIWPGVVGRTLHAERVTVAVVELEPGRLVPEHNHVNEQVGVLLRGSLCFRVGRETRELEPGGMWSIGADLPHEVEAGPDGALLIEIFSPPRDDWHDLERQEPRPLSWPL